MSRYGPIRYQVDFAAKGKQIGNLSLDHSDDANDYSVIPIPIAVIANGDGPTVLLTAGNHGNEYEGQVALRTLVHEIDADEVNGRMIVLPSLNMPAVQADARVSPLDNGNLNRLFPGDQTAGPTAAIAGFLSDVIFPICDAGIDLHTGGAHPTFVPLAYLCHCDDQAVFAASAELSEAFAAPWTYLVTSVGDDGGMDPEAHRQGVAFISTELGGGARLGRETLGLALRGVRNVLKHLKVLRGEVEREQTRYLTDVGGSRLISPVAGFLESKCELGQTLRKGDEVAVVHPVEDAFASPTVLEVPGDGVVVAMRTTARVAAYDVILDIARELSRDAFPV